MVVFLQPDTDSQCLKSTRESARELIAGLDFIIYHQPLFPQIGCKKLRQTRGKSLQIPGKFCT